jgi:hypothetical protein
LKKKYLVSDEELVKRSSNETINKKQVADRKTETIKEPLIQN